MSAVDWLQLRGTRENTPLDRLGVSWERIAVARDEATALYQIGENAYAVADERPPVHLAGPRITRFFWAPSAGAARRAALGDVEHDDGAWRAPPDILLPLRGRYRFGDVVSLAESGTYGDRAWSYLWRMSVDEHCLGRIIYLGMNSYYFRSILFDPDDPVYAVELDVRSLKRLLSS